MLKLPKSYEESFKHRIGEFLATLPIADDDKTACEVEIVRLVLQIQNGSGSATIRKNTFALGVLEEFTYFKNHYLDFSQYLNRVLWVLVPEFIREKEIHSNKHVAADIEYCLSVVTSPSNAKSSEDFAKLSKKQINSAFNIDFMTIDENWVTGKKTRRSLSAYVKSKVGTVKFLWDYDLAFEQEDFEQELIVEVLRVFNTYPKSKGTNAGLDDNSESSIRNRVEMYIEMAINNKVNNLKEYYTCDNRQRVSNSHSALYKEKKKIKKLITKAAKEIAEMGSAAVADSADKSEQLMTIATRSEETPGTREEKEGALAALRQSEVDLGAKIKNTETDYRSIVTPMVNRDESGEESTMELNGEEVGFNVGPTSPYSAHSIENSVWTNKVVERLRIDGEEKIARFVEIIVHEHDPAFDAWADQEGVNTNNPALRARGAKTFLGLSSKELKSSRLSGWLKSNIG
jgi:hypothetical protein